MREVKATARESDRKYDRSRKVGNEKFRKKLQMDAGDT